MSGTDNPGPEIPGEVPDLDGPNEETAVADSSVEDSAAFHSQAYSAPESEQFTLYDEYETQLIDGEEPPPPRWPWVVGVAAIIAAITLVASVALLVAGRSDKTNGAARSNTVIPTPSITPWNEIITTTLPPPPPPPTSEPPPPPPVVTETVTVEPAPPPEPATTHEAPPPVTTTTTPPPPTTTTPAGPRQITYSVTGFKSPIDRVSITWTDGSGRTRVNPGVTLPWSITVTPISNSEIGSLSATSFLRLSQLNCTITTSDGQVLSSNNNNSAQATC